LPYVEAVAARFNAPAVVYSTPGLQAGRTSWSSPAEAQTWLREQQRRAVRAGIKANVVALGTTPGGHPIEALVLTKATGAEPQALTESQRPTVLLVGQQQGGAPAASEALLVVARELSQGLLTPLLDKINVIVVPQADPDAATSPPGYLASTAPISTISMARSTDTTPSTNVEQDHLRLATPQARALAALARDFQPVVVLEAHEYPALGKHLETFGLLPSSDLRFAYAMAPNLPEFLTKAADEWFRRPLLAALKPQGLSAEWTNTASGDRNAQQVHLGSASPESLVNAYGLKNIISLRIESRGAGLDRLHAQRRVHTQVTAMASVLASTAQRASELGQLRPYLDTDVSAQACQGEMTIAADPTPAELDLTLLDPMSGAERLVTVQSQSSLALRKTRVRVRPCGYWLASDATDAAERLRMHGVKVLKVSEPSSMLGDMFRPRASASGPADVSLLRGLIDTPAGSFFVPLDQPLGNLIAAALEPDAQGSFVATGLLRLPSVARVMTKPAGRLGELP
jgi:hypothetical protein